MSKTTFKVWASGEGPSDARQVKAHHVTSAVVEAFCADFDECGLEPNVEYTYWAQHEGSEKVEQYEISRRIETKISHVETRDVSEWEVSE